MRKGCAPLLLAILALVIGVLVIQFRSSRYQPEQISINEVAGEIQEGNVIRLIVEGDDVEIIFNDGTSVFSRKEENTILVEQLLLLGVSEEMLSSENILIEVGEPGLFDSIYLVQFLIFVGAGFILGAFVMLMLARSGYIPVGGGDVLFP
jgi:hypothetical protein